MRSGHHEDMICLETQHFNINKNLLLAIGLWPYRQSKFVHLQFTVFLIILISASLFQLTTFFTAKCTPNFVLNILSTTFFFMTFMIKYSSFRANMENVKDLIEQLQYVCNELKNEDEISIMKRYGYYAKCYTIGLAVFDFSAISACIINQLRSVILDDIAPTNGSHLHHVLYMTEYFLDQKKNFYVNLVHMNVALFIGATAMIAIRTTQIAYMQHTCGMFKIACYRIEHAAEINIENNKLQNISFRNNNFIPKGINFSVDMHRQAMKLSKLLVYIFETSFFWLIILGVASLSLNLLRIFQIDSFTNNAKEFLLHTVTAAVCVIYMFLANYCGQDVTDHNDDVFASAYNVQWYTASLYTQKLILLLLQRGNKDFTLGIGGLFVGSLDCFASLVKASVSYFTVIYSTR